jgi:alanine racemase
VSAQEHADAAGTIIYEILCGLSPRVPRIYVP